MKYSLLRVLLVFPGLLSLVHCTLAQATAPVIFVHPTNRVVSLGGTTVFNVGATGAPPLSYRWFKDGTLMDSRINSSLVLSNVSAVDVGFYFAEVSNLFGSATSRTGQLFLAASTPTITAQPVSRTGFIGGTATFSVTAIGAQPLFYHWLKDGGLLSNRTNRVLTLSNAVAGDAGFYSVIVTNSFGSVTSQPASLTLTGAPPSIFLVGTNILLCAGADPTLSAFASGTPPLRYQWRLDGIDLPDANTNLLFIPGNPANAGAYSVVVTNYYGAVTSSVATVEPGPRIVEQPAGGLVQIGDQIYLRVIATACEPHYQWRFNSMNLNGQTNYLLSWPADLTGSGSYSVVVSDTFRSVTSAVASIVVTGQPPVITYQPADIVDVFWITNITFGVGYYAVPPPNIQWRFNGANLPGGTNAYLSLSGTPNQQGDYSVVLSNVLGVVTSRVARFSYSTAALLPGIWPFGQPSSQALCPWTNVVLLYVNTINPPTIPLFFQWRKDGVSVPGATNSLLELEGVPSDVGDYTVVITNAYGAVTSEVARVSVGLAIISQPEDELGLPEGSGVYLSVEVSSCGEAQYQWQRNGVNVSGETNHYFLVSPATLASSGDYRVIVRNDYAAVTSRVARLEVVQIPPEVLPGYPFDAVVDAGQYAYFYIGYAAAPEPTFQWRFNGADIPGETNASLQFITSSLQQAGGYSVVLSNATGATTSRVAQLTITVRPPEILAEYPQDQTTAAGQYAYFGILYYAAPAPTFQWRFNGVNLPDATNGFLQFMVASTNQAGGYSVVLSNEFGVATSRVAQLTVLVKPPQIHTQPVDWNVMAGTLVSFYVGAEAAPPPTYQWRLNGVNIPHATEPVLFFTAGFTNQEGGYSVVVSNEFGSVTSRVATLDIILQEPRFTMQPQNVWALVGGRASFLTALFNNPPAFFQWQIDGVDLPGATNNYLYLYDLQTSASGAYRVIAWNDGGRATSDVATLTVRLPDTLDYWHRRRPSPQGNDLYSITHDGTHFLAVGDTGAIVMSTNGVDWVESHRVGDEVSRLDVAAGGGVFVCKFGGGLQASTNGVDWINVGPGVSSFYLASVAYGAGRFMALGQSTNGTTVVVSTNGWDWEQLLAFTQFYPVKLAFAGGLFLASCHNPQDIGDNHFFASSDGNGWVPCANPSGGGLFTDFAQGAGTYVSVSFREFGFVALSPNGLSWSSQLITNDPPFPPTTVAPYAVAYGAGRFVTVGTRYGAPSIASSTDGQNWSHIPGIATNGLFDVTFGAGRFVAVGHYGAIVTSTDGLNWSNASSGGSDRNLRDITRGGGLYVAVGNGGMIFTSPDGKAWTEGDSGTANNLRAATFFQNHFVVLGDADNAGGTVLNSADGVTWSRSSAPASFFGMAHNGERLVAVGNSGVILNSTDGSDWSSVFNATNFNPAAGVDLNAVTWGGGQFVAVGRNGNVLVSSNGWKWAAKQIMPYNIHGVAFGNGLYLAVARNGWVARSTNATDWQTFNILNADEFSDIGFGGGQFIAVGADGMLYSTVNGLDWISRSTSCQFDLRAVLYAEGSFYIAGDNETILQSRQIAPLLRVARRASDGALLLEVFAEAGRGCLLQGSSDLAHWSDLATFIGSTRPNPYTIPATAQWQFYRVVCP